MANEQHESHEGLAAADALDRRAMLKRLGLGVAAAGAWVTPQVVGAPAASAACSPIIRRFQVDPDGCGSLTPNSIACTPANWGSATNAAITFTCSAPDTSTGGSVTVTSTGCTPISATATRVCTGGSGGPTTNCVTGTISGSTVTFPPVGGSPLVCVYTDFRIVVSCCV